MRGWDVDRAATVLLKAEADRKDRDPITDQWPDLDLATAYAVQDETLRRRLLRGERLAGLKLGLTSRVKQQPVYPPPPGRPRAPDPVRYGGKPTVPRRKSQRTSPTRPPARRCWATRPRPWRWPPTSSRGEGWPSSRAGSSSPGA